MIEIIKKGTKTKCTCKQCGCLFTYEEEDMTVDHNYDNRFTDCIRKFVTCPQCSNKITVGGVK